MKNKLIVLGLVAVLATGTLAPSFAGRAGAAVGAAPVAARVHSNPAGAFTDKIKFLFHMGLAYYAVHHFVILPYQRHDFSAGSAHRTTAFIKAGVALLFAYHEAKVSYNIAVNSKSTLLRTLVKPLVAFGTTLGAVGTKLHPAVGQGTPAPPVVGSEQDISGTVGAFNSFDQTARGQGLTINDVTPPGGGSDGLAA